MNDRFWSKVDASGDCWEWTAAIKFGYGSFWVKPRQVQAHRMAWELLVGPIPEGLELDHLCRNRRCVNPDHLEPVTHQVNQLRGRSATGRNASKTHCVNGHPLAGANLVVRKGHNGNDRRDCLACRKEAGRRWAEKKRAS